MLLSMKRKNTPDRVELTQC